jgi:hypothetical protein
MVYSRVSPLHQLLAVAGLVLILSACAGKAAGRTVPSSEAVAAQVRQRDSAVAELTAVVEALRMRLDSLTNRSDSLRASTLELREAIRVRDEQLRVARVEVQRLKDIDLKSPRKPPTR